MTSPLSRLLPLLALTAALLAGSAAAVALAGGDTDAGPEAAPAFTSEDIAPGECYDGRCGPGGAGTAAACIEGVPDCNDTIAVPLPADCPPDAVECDDIGFILPAGCEQIYDDLVACVADPSGPVDIQPVSPDEPPPAPPDGSGISKPDEGGGSAPNSGDLVPPDECSLVHNVDACAEKPQSQP